MENMEGHGILTVRSPRKSCNFESVMENHRKNQYYCINAYVGLLFERGEKCDSIYVWNTIFPIDYNGAVNVL